MTSRELSGGKIFEYRSRDSSMVYGNRRRVPERDCRADQLIDRKYVRCDRSARRTNPELISCGLSRGNTFRAKFTIAFPTDLFSVVDNRTLYVTPCFTARDIDRR